MRIHALLMRIGTDTLENNLAVPHYVKYGGPAVSQLGIYPRGLKTPSHTNLYISVHSGIIHKSHQVMNG